MKKNNFWNKLKNTINAIKMMKRQKPYKFWPMAMLVCIFIGSVGITVYQIDQDLIWRGKVYAAHEITFKDFKGFIEAKKVQDLTAISIKTDRGPLAYLIDIDGITNVYFPSEINAIYRSKSATEKDDFVIHGMEDLKTHEINANHAPELLSAWFSAGTIFVLFGVIVGAQFFIQEVLTGKSFIPKSLNYDVHFNNIIGYQDVKDQFVEIKDFLKNKNYYLANNLEIPKGILLTGSPGVGKTMFAKALANEMKVAFFLATGSDFVELYVGLGAKRVRELFKRAKVAGKAIIFIDEIDALGSRSQAYMDSERLSTLNQLLSEMDGAEERGDIIIIGATNFPEKLDPALMRPGRFDRQIYIPLPDLTTRIGLLEYYLKDHQLSDDVNLKQLAITLAGASGADIKKFVDVAKMKASKENIATNNKNLEQVQTKDKLVPVISRKTLMQVKEENLLGIVQNKIQNGEERDRVAYHELGHAFAIKKFMPNSKVEKVSILPRGQALGVTLNYPVEELRLHTRKMLLGHVRVLLGGRAAEEVFTSDISNGAADDLNKASEIVKKMVNEWGLGKKNQFLTFTQNNQGMYQQLENKDEINEILQEQYQAILEHLKERREDVEKLKIILIEKESLDEDELSVI